MTDSSMHAGKAASKMLLLPKLLCVCETTHSLVEASRATTVGNEGDVVHQVYRYTAAPHIPLAVGREASATDVAWK